MSEIVVQETNQSSLLSPTNASLVPFDKQQVSSGNLRERKRKRTSLHSGRGHVSEVRPGNGANAQQRESEGQPVRRRNGFTIMGDDHRAETPVNGSIASRRNDGSGSLGSVQETNSVDSEDELPLPSSLHSVCSYEDSPPKGLLYSSPGGCRRQKTRNVEKKKKFVAVAAEKSPTAEYHSPAPKETERAQPIMQTETAAESDSIWNRIKPVTAAIVVEDTAKEKTEEIARLQRRVSGVKDDIWALQRQIDVNETFQMRKIEDKVDTNNLFHIVLRYLGDEDLCNQTATPSIPLSKSLTSFLPFAKPIRPATPPPKVRPPSFPVTEPQSARATKLDDPIPYLEFFTPLNFTRIISRDFESECTTLTTVQSHSITFRSPGNLLEGTMQMSYDTATETITRIRLLKISEWADRELGSWIRKRISGSDNGEKEDQCNVSIIAWAMGRYWDFALARAQCWMRCERAHAEIVGSWAGAADISSGPSRQRRKKTETNKSQSNESIPDFEDSNMAVPDKELINELARIFHSSKNPESLRGTNNDTDTHTCADAGNTSIEPSIDAASPHLGRQLFKLHGGGGDVELYIDYQIELDWTGEAQSIINADLAVPGPWREIDEQDALGKVPILFQHMRKHGSVYNAVRVLLKLFYT